MDVQEATIAMAFLMKKEIDFYKEFIEGKVGSNDPDTIASWRRFEYLKSTTREFGNRLAANPAFFDIMESWIIVVSGQDGVSRESMAAAAETDDVNDLVDKSGSLAYSVKEFLKAKGCFICDMGAGEDGWDVGTRCSEKKSRTLCDELYKNYRKAIDMDLLFISRRFAGHCLPDLYCWEDAERIIKTLGTFGVNLSEGE